MAAPDHVMSGKSTGPAGADEARFRKAAAILAMPPYIPDPDLPAALLKRHYGLAGTITSLSSEFERTLAVALPDGRRLILKMSDKPEAADSFRFQAMAMAGLRVPSGFSAPQVLRTTSGEAIFDDDGVSGYLQSRIEGVPLHTVTPTPGLSLEIGKALGRLDLALAEVDAPASRRPVLWQIGSWPLLVDLMPYVPTGRIADCVKTAMAQYVEHIQPWIADLEWQITHNDPSPFNMFLTSEGIGFIDFGDGGWNPGIQDLAIAASHFVTDPRLSLGGAEHIVAGYASVRPLSALEESLLVGMMRARQSALILINYWRAQLFPRDAEYIKKNVERAERGLLILASLDAVSGEAAVRSAISHCSP